MLLQFPQYSLRYSAPYFTGGIIVLRFSQFNSVQGYPCRSVNGCPGAPRPAYCPLTPLPLPWRTRITWEIGKIAIYQVVSDCKILIITWGIEKMKNCQVIPGSETLKITWEIEKMKNYQVVSGFDIPQITWENDKTAICQVFLGSGSGVNGQYAGRGAPGQPLTEWHGLPSHAGCS